MILPSFGGLVGLLVGAAWALAEKSTSLPSLLVGAGIGIAAASFLACPRTKQSIVISTALTIGTIFVGAIVLWLLER